MVDVSRRALLGGMGLGVVPGCLTDRRPSFGPGTWTRLRADAGQTNYSPTPGPVEDAEIAWSRSVEPGWPAILLAEDRLYVGPSGTVKHDDTPSLSVLDAESGQTRFRVANVGGLYGIAPTTAYGNGMVLASGHSNYSDDALLGVNPGGGPAPRRWTSGTPTVAATVQNPVADRVSVVDGTLYYCSSHSPTVLQAVDVDDGRRTWARRIGDSTVVSMAADSDRLVVTTRDDGGTVRLVEPDDGRMRVKTVARPGSVPMLREDTVILVSDRDGEPPVIEAREADTLEPRWEAEVEAGSYDPEAYNLLNYVFGPNSVVVASGGFFADESDNEGDWWVFLTAFDTRDGDRLWRRRIATRPSPSEFRDWGYSLTMGGRTVYAVGYGGSVVAVRSTDGAIRWRLDFGRSAYSAGRFIVGQNRLYGITQSGSGGRDKRVHALVEP